MIKYSNTLHKFRTLPFLENSHEIFVVFLLQLKTVKVYRRRHFYFPLGGKTILAGKIPAELAVCHYAIWRHPEDIGETPEKLPQTSLSIVYISCY